MPENKTREDPNKSLPNGKTARRIFTLIRPYWHWVAALIFFILLSSFVDSVQFYINKLLIDDGILKGDMGAVRDLIGKFAVIFCVQVFSVFAFIYIGSILGERVNFDLRKRLFTHIQELTISYFSVTPVGWIMSRVNSDTYRISDLVTWGIIDSVFSIMNIVISLFFMFRINAKMASIVLLSMPILLWLAWQFRRRILAEFRIVRKLNSQATGFFNEEISGIRVTKAQQRESENLKEFQEITRPMYHAAFHAAWLNALFLPTIQIVASITLAIIIYASGIQIKTGLMTIGGIQAFVNYITSMMWPVQDLARVYGEMQQSIASGERVFSLLDAKPSFIDKPNAIDVKTMKGEIVFDHVEFFYDDDITQTVLKDFSLRVKQGETIAFVGSTGGGKTTIINLLCRFHEPKKGAILINGQDYADLSAKSIQSRIGVVLQTPHLFSGTIMENIRYGKLDASDEEIMRAAQLSGAENFILSLPNGYQQQVGEGGNLLSVGQKQLISLARAILTDPDIFIMDEATSSVDAVTENLIQKGMNAMMEGRSSFIIAHRLSTIKNADRILVIENGAIAESGTHKELLSLRGRYYALYTRQFKEEIKIAK